MKKLLILFVLFAAILIAGSGCLKDSDFEDQRYGIQVAEMKAVAFPQTASSPVVVGITGQAEALTVAGPFITIEGIGPATSDVTVQLATNDTAVTNEGLTLLPAGTYNLNTLAPKIAAGDTFTRDLQIIITNSDALDPNISYGIGLTITGVDAGYKVASNMSTVVIAFNIKNKYDGIYSVVSGTVTRYTAPGVPAGDALSGSLAGNADVILATAGPNSVSIPLPGDGALQWAAGTDSYVAGIDGLIVVVDPATNLTTITSQSNPTLANWAGKENKYDPATKTFYLGFKWNPTASVREYDVVLQYKGPRP